MVVRVASALALLLQMLVEEGKEYQVKSRVHKSFMEVEAVVV